MGLSTELLELLPSEEEVQYYNMVLARKCDGVPDLTDTDAFPTLFYGRGVVQ
jgi:hypothetical protein